MGEFHRGMRTVQAGPDDAAEEGGFNPETSNSAGTTKHFITVLPQVARLVAAAKENRMDGIIVTDDLSALVDDRVDEGMFRVDGAVYTEQDIFEQEVTNIFEKCWVFLCHESQVANHGDYFWTEIGRQPVYVHRQEDGSLKCFINACSHRAAILTPFRQGNAKTLTCRFHGWTYKCSGDCVGIKNEEEGTDRSKFDLREIASLASYRGFVFGSLSADVPSIEDWLGAAATWIDLMVAQSPDGLEVVPGNSTYKTNGNWKLQAENSVDGYHVSTVHRVFAHTIAARKARANTAVLEKRSPGASRAVCRRRPTIWAMATWRSGLSTRHRKCGLSGKRRNGLKRNSSRNRLNGS